VSSYSGWPFHYKYFGLGEPIVFLLAGPLVTAGAAALYFPDSRELLRFAALSLPLSFLVTLRLHSGNMQRIPFDTTAHVLTIARFQGFRWSKAAYAFLVVAPFLCVTALAATGVAPFFAIYSLLAVPFAVFALFELKPVSGPLDPLSYELRRNAARLHTAFGILYCLGFLLF